MTEPVLVVTCCLGWWPKPSPAPVPAMTAGLSRSRPLATASTRYGCGAPSSRPTLPRGKSARVYSTDRGAGRHAPEGVRQPPGVGLPLLLGDLSGRQLPAPGRRAAGRQRRPGDCERASAAVLTFTAPSFGRVHTRKAQGRLVFPCHPYRQGQTCPHGRRAGCWQRHDEDDPRLGEPLCARCYQTGAQVLWNALAGRLWSRTTIYLYRALAQLVGVPEGELRRLVRVSFAKVAEYQRRGAVHFHAIIRLDAATDCGCSACVASPPGGFTAELLEAAIRQTATTVSVPCPVVDEDQGVTLTARWGEQLDVRRITEAGDEGSCRLSRWPAMSPSTRPRPPRPSASPLTIVSARSSWTTWTCRPMWPSSSGRAGSWAAARAWLGCGCASGRTCLASAATSRPRAVATRPPWARCGGPGSPTLLGGIYQAGRAGRPVQRCIGWGYDPGGPSLLAVCGLWLPDRGRSLACPVGCR